MLPLANPQVTPDDDDGSRPRHVPWGGLVARLRASVLLRRFVPAPVALAAIDAGMRLSVARRPEKLDGARAAMEAVVGGTSWPGDRERLAFRHLCAWSRGWEHAWRPWLLKRIPIEGLELLQDVEPGRGLILSKTHSGPPGGMRNLARLLAPVHQAAGGFLFADAPPGYDGYQNEQVRTLLTEGGFRITRATGAAAEFARALKDGGRVLLNFDVPGSAPVQFLGKTVELKSGTARLAFDTDAVVVPVALLPRGRGWVIHVDRPLDPREHADWQSLLQAVAAVHERFVLQAPELLESPLRDGAWATATADGWRRA